MEGESGGITFHMLKDFGSNAFSVKNKNKKAKNRILFMFFPIWWILFITGYCMGKVPVGVSQKRAVQSAANSQQVILSWRQLEVPLLWPCLTCGMSNEFRINELGGEKSPTGTFCHQLSMFSF